MLLNGLLIPKYQLIRTEGLESKVLMAGDDIITIEIAFNTKVQSEKIKDIIAIGGKILKKKFNE